MLNSEERALGGRHYLRHQVEDFRKNERNPRKKERQDGGQAGWEAALRYSASARWSLRGGKRP